MDQPFTLRRRVEFADTDMAGLLHFSRFFAWMEAAEHAFMKHLGMEPLEKTGDCYYGWPKAEASCEYISPLRFGDELDLTVEVVEVRNRSLTLCIRFFKVGQAEPCAIGKLATVYVKSDASGTFIPQPIKPFHRARLAGE